MKKAVRIAQKDARLGDIFICPIMGESVEVSWSKKAAIHTFPYSDVKIIEDQGWNNDQMSLSFEIDKTMYRSQGSLTSTIKKLETLLKSRKMVKLVHPVLGKLTIVVTQFKKTVGVGEAHFYPTFTITFEVYTPRAVKKKSFLRNLLMSLLSKLPIKLLQLIIIAAILAPLLSKGMGMLRVGLRTAAGFLDTIKLKIAELKNGMSLVYNAVSKTLIPTKDGLPLPTSKLTGIDNAFVNALQRVNTIAQYGLQATTASLPSSFSAQKKTEALVTSLTSTFKLDPSLASPTALKSFTGYMDIMSAAVDSFEVSVGASPDALVDLNKKIEDSLADSQALLSTRGVSASTSSRLSTAEQDIAIRANEYMVFTTQLLTVGLVINEILNSEEDELTTASNGALIDSTLRAMYKMQDYYSTLIDESDFTLLTEITNQLQAYKEEISPLLYSIIEVDVHEDLVSNVVYNNTGSLDTLEATLRLNNLITPDIYSGKLKIYFQN